MNLSLSASSFWKTLAAATLMLSTSPSFAQRAIVTAEGSGHSGGGNVTESDLRSYMGKMDVYFQSREGKAAFPEIVEYDRVHSEQESFHHIIAKTKPTVKAADLFDSLGEPRDCMSYANPDGRYFVCDSRKLPEASLENQPSFYRIVLHELFVQAGIEKPISKAVPSDYEVSYRITQNVHLETYQEWAPGLGSKLNSEQKLNPCRVYIAWDSLKIDIQEDLEKLGCLVVEDKDDSNFAIWLSNHRNSEGVPESLLARIKDKFNYNGIASLAVTKNKVTLYRVLDEPRFGSDKHFLSRGVRFFEKQHQKVLDVISSNMSK